MSTSAARQDVLTHLRAEIRRLERRPALRAGVLPSGVPAVDALLPGGFPCGALSELRGGPACGKTAVALSLMARLPAGALAAWIDGRGELYPPAAAAMGVDLGRLLIVRPPPGEEGAKLSLWAAEALLGSGAFAAVAVDVGLDRPWRGADAALRRLVPAAEQGGAAGLWLSTAGATLRPPAPIRLDLRVEGRRVVAARASGGGQGAAEGAAAEPRAGGRARGRPGGIHAA